MFAQRRTVAGNNQPAYPSKRRLTTPHGPGPHLRAGSYGISAAECTPAESLNSEGGVPAPQPLAWRFFSARASWAP